MQKDTAEIANQIKNAKSPEELLPDVDNSLPPLTLAQYLNSLLTERKLKKSQLALAAGIDASYCCHLLDGTKKTTARPRLLAIACALSLSEKETRRLPYYAGQPQLYPRVPWDAAVIYALQNKLTVIETNLMLEQLHLQPLLN